jgi:hypothetical protein
MKHCQECVSEMLFNVEGGRVYRAKSPHVNVGLHDTGSDTPLLDFCVKLVSDGESVSVNCGGARAVMVHYMRRIDGSWVRLNPNW